VSSGLVWFRKDLRLTDNPAWAAATYDNEAVVALFVIDPRLWDAVLPHRRAQLAANLRSLDRQLDSRGGRLKVEIGDPALIVPVAAETHQTVYWNAPSR
jgi:deoxyribodipyrimidine photo-lyase